MDTVKVWSWRKLPIEPNQDTQVVAPAEMEVMELERPHWYVDISGIDFKAPNNKWHACLDSDLFHAPLERTVNPNFIDLKMELEKQVREWGLASLSVILPYSP